MFYTHEVQDIPRHYPPMKPVALLLCAVLAVGVIACRSSTAKRWARVKNEDLQIGYVKFENIKIVHPEEQPQPKERRMDEELDQNMKLE